MPTQPRSVPSSRVRVTKAPHCRWSSARSSPESSSGPGSPVELGLDGAARQRQQAAAGAGGDVGHASAAAVSAAAR